ncbi:hypothetical protein B4U37_20175 [Sutcliffiella horikoshii]|uniref:Uncharacterized protein n=1 Tax=Sutcliffiella horikoshii TaxID=79883 RepID=A0ABN4ZIB7_9BACI|nr:hypothetical protein B4U37_20175 [Sutcliffiella horikoshii]
MEYDNGDFWGCKLVSTLMFVWNLEERERVSPPQGGFNGGGNVLRGTDPLVSSYIIYYCIEKRSCPGGCSFGVFVL